MLLFFIRHGDPIYVPDSLTPQGERQTAALSKRLANCGITRIFTSCSNRAQRTAKPTAERLGIEPTVLDWASEDENGKYLYVHAPEGDRRWVFQSPHYVRLFRSPEVRALGAEWYKAPVFAGSGFEEVVRRFERYTDDFFASLGYRHDRESGLYRVEHPTEDRVAFFAHQGFGMIFFSSMLGIPYPEFCTHFDFGHSSMSVIEFEPFGADDPFCVPRVLQLSNDSHLYREGLPTNYQNRLKF